MLTTDDLAEYLRIAEKAKAAGGFCIRVTPEHAIELCRVYAAVLGAPEVWARPWIWEEVPEELEGQLIRLVPLGAGKGEGDG